MKKKIEEYTFEDYVRKHFSKEQRKQMEADSEYMVMLARLRNRHKITQKQMELLLDIKTSKKPIEELDDSFPRVNTLIRLLKPMGLTLKIVPIKEKR